MNRQEAAAILKDNLYGFVGDDITEALYLAVEALEGPAPDPKTGLVPCGCGCKPELRDDGWGWHQVYCTGCDMHGGNSHTPDGVIEEWNTAMGWRVEG